MNSMMTNAKGRKSTAAGGSAVALSVLSLSLLSLSALPAIAADAILSGSITSDKGEMLSGVTVSAKGDGQTITTSVYTDADGNYYFPPMAEGKYKVWAQAIKFDTAKSDVDLSANKKQDFKLAPFEDFAKQLPGDEMLAALPGDTPDDARMKNFVAKNCTGCHSASFPLQHKFDDAGWTAMLELMKQVNVLGTYRQSPKNTNQNIQAHEKELAAYLARARGPGPTSMKFNLRPRPSGEAARVVTVEYDVPTEPGHRLDTLPLNDGSDWTKGTPSDMFGNAGVHDAQMDLDGNVWFSFSHPSYDITIGRIDAKTGKVKFFKINDVRGFAAGTHGMARDQKGIIWFNTRSNVQRGHGGLGKVDPKTQQIQVYFPPKPMSGTAGTLDVDNNGFIWVTSPDGVLRFDPQKETFQEFKSKTYKYKNGGVATVYGLAADSTGNAWWVLMKEDLIDKSHIDTGETTEFKLQPDEKGMEHLTDAERKMYETFVPPDFNTPFPWAQAPRRLGADKNGDTVWVGDSFGANFARIDIKTSKTTFVPMPNRYLQPYEVAIDSKHNVWTNLWSTDAVTKYDPATQKWTVFDLPTRGTESRYISLLEQNGKIHVTIPYSRARKVAVMTPRSEQELAALKEQAAK
jgi:virginiamycin B lyase